MQGTVCVHSHAAPVSRGGLDREVTSDHLFRVFGLAVQTDFDVYTESFGLSSFGYDNRVCAPSD